MNNADIVTVTLTLMANNKAPKYVFDLSNELGIGEERLLRALQAMYDTGTINWADQHVQLKSNV